MGEVQARRRRNSDRRSFARNFNSELPSAGRGALEPSKSASDTEFKPLKSSLSPPGEVSSLSERASRTKNSELERSDVDAKYGSGNFILGGNGNDQIIVSSSNFVWGEDGSDFFDAKFSSGGNVLLGGKGNDEFLLGMKDRLVV